MSLAYIALGSNLGDRAAYLHAARHTLAAMPGSAVTRCSAIYETDPVGPVNQNRYLNAVIELQTTLTPQTVMQHLLHIESDAGRVRRGKWGPRTLDLDLLLYDDQIINTDALTVPHPQLHQRTFVLQPLCDIDHTLVHPQWHKSVAELLEDLKSPPLKRYETHAGSDHFA